MSRSLRGIPLAVAIVTFVGSLGLIMLSSAPLPPPASTCWPGSVPTVDGLTEKQVRVAVAIWRTARSLAGATFADNTEADEASVIAIAVANQESSLGIGPGTDKPNADNDAGIFQQRILPGWYGTLDQVNDPAWGAKTFFLGVTVTPAAHRQAAAAGVEPAGPVGYHIPGLVNVPGGWQDKSIVDAAHHVQRSAFPTAIVDDIPIARQLVAAFRQGVTDNPTAATNLDQAACAPVASVECAPSGLSVEQGLTPDAVRVVRCTHASFPQIRSMGGVGDRPANVDDDHQTGRAVDIMIPDWRSPHGAALGQQIATWAQNNATQLGVTYIIWDGRIWSVARASEGWRQCGAQASCYAGPNATLAHRDHVHISVHGNAGGTDTAGTAQVTGDPGQRVAPVTSATITARWGQVGSWSRYHTGVDYGAPIGTPIRAAAAGTITHAGTGGPAGGWAGHYVIIRHSDGTHTLYAHLAASRVSPGQVVAGGQPIGVVGMTGRTFGPHLHFELYPPGKRPGSVYDTINPLPWLTASTGTTR